MRSMKVNELAMPYKLRQSVPKDAGQLAYLLLLWDAELPPFLRMIRGDAASAARTADTFVYSPHCVAWVAEQDDKLIGAITIQTLVSMFGYHTYGSVIGVFVTPEHRGGKLIGLRLIKKAMELKPIYKWAWLEMSPWADDVNTMKVLGRLGFAETLHTYVLR